MNRVFSRPLFKGNFVQRYAQGGIVSTVMGPEEQDPMAILTGMAEQVDATEQNLDAANNIDEILTSFAGTPKTAQDARAELAELVGPRDAEATPESVLALVQPTMAIMEMSRQMSPPGGIASMPMEEAAPMEGAAPTNFTPAPDGSPVPGFAVGGQVDYNQIMQDYAGMQQAIPRQYGADPASAWLALAQLGAGLAQGKTFAQGLSMGTQLAAPVMQQGIQNVRDERSRLSQFVAAEATRQKEAAQRAAELAESRAFEEGQTQKQIDARIRLKQIEAGELPADQRTAERIALGEGLVKGTDAFERRVAKLLIPKDASESTADIRNAERKAQAAGFEPGTDAYEAAVLDYMTEKADSPDTIAAIQRAQRISELQLQLDADPTNKRVQYELDALKAQSGGVTVNLGDKAGAGIIDKQFASEQKYLETLRTESQAARTTKQALAPVLTMLEPVRRGEQPPYISGAGGDSWRLYAGQAFTTINEMANLGLTKEQIAAAVGGDPAAGEVLRASMARLRTGMSEALSRVTNLQLEVLRDQLPNLSMTPRGNLFVADMLNRTADRTLKVERYAQQLERTYAGTINPANKPAEYRDELYKAAGVTAFNGYETGKPFDENGKPIMSLNEYISYLDNTEPLLTKAEIAELQRFERGEGTLFNEMASGKEVRGDGTQPWETDPNNIPGTRFVFGGREWIRTKNGKVPAPGRN